MQDPRVRRDAARMLRKIAKSFGVRVRRDRSASVNCDSTYTGRAFNLGGRDEYMFVSDLAHELAHFIVAPEPCRRAREFGYTSSYESSAKAALRDSMFDEEEHLASATGIWLLKNVGDNSCALETIHDHSWDFTPFLEYTRRLLSEGILYRDAMGKVRVDLDVWRTE